MPFIQLQFRRGTATQWTAANPVLAAGELAIETNTNQFKIGDGVTPYNDLPYGGFTGPTGPGSDVAGIANNAVLFTNAGSLTGSSLFTFDPTSGPTGEVIIRGKLTVDGIIDPIGFLLTPENHYDSSMTGIIWRSTTSPMKLFLET